MKTSSLTTLLFLVPAILQSQDIPNLKNVVVILSDDHALKVTGSYGNDIIRTPNIDQLANEGVMFTNAYCNAPICSASRQSLLTGKYPHATGVNLLFTPFPDEGNVTIAEHLKKFDYATAIVGKTHWNNWVWGSLYRDGMPDHGFDRQIENEEYRKFIRENPPPAIPENLEFYDRNKPGLKENIAEQMNWRVLPHPIDDEHSMGTFFAREAIEFMKENKDNPFFLWLAFKEPHQPFYFPVEYAGKYRPEDMLLPEGSPEDDRWVPEKFRNLTEEEKRGIIAAYYTSTEYMDKNTGLVLDAIESLGLEENTLVIYISDNGYLLHEHKRFEKHTMWEESVNQPMIFRMGKGVEAGRKEEALVEYLDIAPTIVDILEVEPMTEAQGKSFRQILNGTSDSHKEFAMSTYLEDNLAMVCNRQWKYMFTTGNRDLGITYKTGFGPSGIVHRLYNISEDPNEYYDVSKDPENAGILLRMQKSMLQRFMETHPDAADCPDDLTLEGKLVWFCEPRDIGADQNQYDVPARVFSNE